MNQTQALLIIRKLLDRAIAIQERDLRAALRLATEALEAARASGSPDELARSLLVLGGMKRMAGAYEEAKLLIRQGVEAAEGNPAFAGKSNIQLAQIYIERGQYTAARQILLESVAYLKEHQQSIEPNLYFNLANCALFLNEFEEARQNFSEAFQGYALAQDERGLARVLASLGLLDMKAERFRSALEQLSRGLDLLRSLNEERNSGIILLHMAECHYNLGEYDRAFGYCLSARDVAEKLGIEPLTAETLRIEGLLHFAMQDREQGLAVLRKSLAMAQTLGMMSLLAELNERIAKEE